jgi:hypothetical protein
VPVERWIFPRGAAFIALMVARVPFDNICPLHAIQVKQVKQVKQTTSQLVSKNLPVKAPVEYLDLRARVGRHVRELEGDVATPDKSGSGPKGDRIECQFIGT